MKKCIFVVFFVSFLLFASLSYAYPSWLINAFATYGNAGISIVIDGSPPTITVYYPLNDTYNYLNNIYLHYYITDQSPISAAWYSLNSGQNTSLSGNITINAQEGANRIRVYANDSLGFLNSTAVAFFVNLSKPDTIILPGCFLEAGSETTNVSGMTRAQIGSIQNLTLHNAGEGKIRFGEMINLSDDNNGSNSGNVKIINLTAYVNLSFNRIYIDTANLPNLNKSATLYLFSLSFTNPRILMNNETCPPTVCTKLSYSNNLLIFNVTHFSEFKAEETPTETPVPASTPSAGGGGGTSTAAVVYPIKTKDLEVFESLIHFNLKEILPSSDYLTIRNPNMFPLEITLFFNPVLKFLDFQGRREKYSTTLLPNETRKIQISVAPHLDIAPGTYQTLLTIAYNQTIKRFRYLLISTKASPCSTLPWKFGRLQLS